MDDFHAIMHGIGVVLEETGAFLLLVIFKDERNIIYHIYHIPYISMLLCGMMFLESTILRGAMTKASHKTELQVHYNLRLSKGCWVLACVVGKIDAFCPLKDLFARAL